MSSISSSILTSITNLISIVFRSRLRIDIELDLDIDAFCSVLLCPCCFCCVLVVVVSSEILLSLLGLLAGISFIKQVTIISEF